MPMSESSFRYWATVGRDLGLTASIAQQILDFSSEGRKAAVEAPQPEWLPHRTADHLAEAICQARDLVQLLENAEKAWLTAVGAKLANGSR